MMLGLPLALAVALAIGFLCVSLLWPVERPGAHLLLRACLGAGVGHGITSCLLFLWLLLHGRMDRSYLAVEAVTLVLLLAAFLLRRRARVGAAAPVGEPPAPLRYAWLVAAGFWASLAVTVAFAAVSVLHHPEGSGWDAWAIYGLRARAIFLGGSQWRDAFSGLIGWAHPDYPLLLPLSTARAWLYCGGEVRSAQAIVTALFALAAVGVVCTTLSALRSRTQGYLAGIVLMGLTTFVGYTSSAYADVPVLFFFAATFALLALRHSWRLDHRCLVLAGLTAGLAAWTKNEGLLFVVCVLAAHLVIGVRSPERRACLRELLFIALGLLPVLAVVLYFKTQLAPPSELTAAMGSQSVAGKLLDRHRYAYVAYTFWLKLTFYSGQGVSLTYLLPIYLACVGATLAHRESLTQLGLTLCLMLAGYFFVYLTTPYDLGFHLKWSLDRVLMQQWPGFVLLYFLAALTPEESFGKGAAAHGGFA